MQRSDFLHCAFPFGKILWNPDKKGEKIEGRRLPEIQDVHEPRMHMTESGDIF